MGIVVQGSDQECLFLNRAKSYTMVFSKSLFCIFLTLFTSDGRCEKEVKIRIGIAKTTFTSMRKVLCISMAVRLRVLKYYIWSIPLYGCETWALMKNMEVAEHWFLRIMLRMPWTDKVSTCEVFHVIRKDETGKGSVNWIYRRDT